MQRINADTIEIAVKNIVPYLEDTSNTAHKAIYFDGWQGLAASAVLRAIAKDPPPSLLKKFDKIIHGNSSVKINRSKKKSQSHRLAEEVNC